MDTCRWTREHKAAPHLDANSGGTMRQWTKSDGVERGGHSDSIGAD
jgi:hypothetical protein